jgi:hypothetical protein
MCSIRSSASFVLFLFAYTIIEVEAQCSTSPSFNVLVTDVDGEYCYHIPTLNANAASCNDGNNACNAYGATLASTQSQSELWAVWGKIRSSDVRGPGQVGLVILLFSTDDLVKNLVCHKETRLFFASQRVPVGLSTVDPWGSTVSSLLTSTKSDRTTDLPSEPLPSAPAFPLGSGEVTILGDNTDFWFDEKMQK